MNRAGITLALFGLAALFGGCGSTGPKEPTSVFATPQQWQTMMDQSVNPRSVGVIVYRSPSGPAFADTNRVHAGRVHEFTFKPGVPMLTVPATGRKEWPVLLDTKSPSSWVTFSAAAALNIRPIGPVPIRLPPTHIDELNDGVAGIASSLTLGDMRLENALLYIYPGINQLGRIARVSTVNPPVVLGCDVLTAFSFVRIDFPQGKVTFSTTDAYRTNALTTLLETDFTITEEGLAVQGIMGDYRGPILIDTAGEYEIAISRPTRPDVPTLVIGDMTLRELRVTDAEFEGFGAESLPVLGVRALQDFSLVLDNQRSKLYLELLEANP
jgi:hypothetical protein